MKKKVGSTSSRKFKHRKSCGRSAVLNRKTQVKVGDGVYVVGYARYCDNCHATADPKLPQFRWVWHKHSCQNPGNIRLIWIRGNKPFSSEDDAELSCKSCRNRALIKRKNF